MARWTASAKWAAGPALDGQRDMPLGLSLNEGLGLNAHKLAARVGAGDMLTLSFQVFNVQLDSLLNESGDLFAGLAGCNTTRKVWHVGAKAARTLFDDD